MKSVLVTLPATLCVRLFSRAFCGGSCVGLLVSFLVHVYLVFCASQLNLRFLLQVLY